jgi:hypothetical protein
MSWAMRRFVGPALPVLLLLLGVPVGPAAAHDGHSHTIEGRFEPELLPETSVWEHVFTAIHSLAQDQAVPGHPTLIAGNLFMSDADAAILLQETAAVRARIRQLEHQLRDARRAGNRPLEEATLKRQIEQAPVEARDRTLRRLSPRGSKALLRWVAAAIRYGMSHGPNR